MRIPPPLPQPRMVDRSWAVRTVAELDRFFASIRGPWVCADRLTTRAGRRVKITLVTAATYTVLDADDVVDVNRAGAVTLTLPASPDSGQRHFIHDSSGAAATNNITIQPAAGDINGAASVVISTNYARRIVIYNGTQWVSA